VSGNRTRNRTFPRLILILASSAFALAAVAAGAVTAGRTATLPSGAHAHAAGVLGPASPASALSVAGATSDGNAIALDAFAQPARLSDAAVARRLSPRQIAWSLLKSHGWTTGQFKYLNLLWTRESGWNPYARNPFSGAYGIPQALPGSKMASAGPAWRTDARTQILWGMHYIKVRYYTPYGAWRHELIYGWY